MILFESVLGRAERGTNEKLFASTGTTPSFGNNNLLSSEEVQQDNSPNKPTDLLVDSPAVEAIINLVSNGTEFLHLFNPNNNNILQEAKNSSAQNMIVVEGEGMKVFPLDGLLTMLIVAFSVSFIVLGGAIPYVFQYTEIYRRKSAAGFSLLVCLALCVANILRIEFWIGKRFELPLLVQSVIMLVVMIAMLEISVRMNRRMIPIHQRLSIWNGNFVEAFWKWNDLSSFIISLALLTVLVSLLNGVFHKNSVFVEALGMSALMVEACLGIPQLLRNFQRKSTIGMSVKMVVMWFVGDVAKTIYFFVRKSPAQFWICSCLQITIDVLILFQVWAYGRRSSAANGSHIPSYVSTSPKA